MPREADAHRARLIYLDQNIWVQLLRGIASGDASATRVRDLLVELRTRGDIRVPLSASHYLESWHRRSERSRHALAGLMRDISGYDTLAPVNVVEEAGVRFQLARLTPKISAPDPRSVLLGHGVNHAFGSNTGRFRVVASLATDDLPEGDPVDPPAALLSAAALGGDAWEWFNLAGDQELIDMDGIEIAPEHRLGRSSVIFERNVRDRVRNDPTVRKRVADFIMTQEMINILDYVNDACEAADVDPHGLFVSPESMRSFVESVPVTNVKYVLRLHRHRDLNYPIEQHDRTDLAALALAIPYCDVVVTERRWCHALERAGLDRKYGTTLASSLSGLAVEIEP